MRRRYVIAILGSLALVATVGGGFLFLGLQDLVWEARKTRMLMGADTRVSQCVATMNGNAPVKDKTASCGCTIKYIDRWFTQRENELVVEAMFYRPDDQDYFGRQIGMLSEKEQSALIGKMNRFVEVNTPKCIVEVLLNSWTSGT